MQKDVKIFFDRGEIRHLKFRVEDTIGWLSSALKNDNASNLFWMLLERAVRLILGFFVGVWVARHLGPEGYGVFSYALAIVGLVAPLATLGLQPLVVSKLVQTPELSSGVIGSALLIRGSSGLIALILVAVAAFFLGGEKRELALLIAILGSTLFFQTTDVLKGVFEARQRLKALALTQISVYILSNTIKVYLILNDGKVIDFAVVVMLESLLGALALVMRCVADRSTEWSLSKRQLSELLSKGWPLAFSGLAIAIYMKIDQVMMGVIAGERALGIYSAAVRLSEIWYFFPTVFVAVIFPSVLAKRRGSESKYLEGTQSMLNTLCAYSFVVAVLVTFFGHWMVLTLYGERFIDAVPVLSLYVWAGVFVALGTGSARWYMVENLQLLHLYKVLLGAALNVLLNALLIPSFGGVGAAVATLASYSASAYFSDYFMGSTKSMFLMKTRSLLCMWVRIGRS